MSWSQINPIKAKARLLIIEPLSDRELCHIQLVLELV